MADILGELEDLENSLFGTRTSSAPKTSTTGGRSTLDSLFSSSSAPAAERPRRERPTVTFNIDNPPAQRSTTSLESLFNEASVPPPRPAATQPRPGRTRATGSSLSGLFGGSSSQSDHESSATPAQTSQQANPPAVEALSRQEDVSRIRRLEEEIERLNREIDDLKRRKKNDEEDLENQWKNRLAKKESDLKEEFDDERTSFQRQIAKLKEGHEEEIERLKNTQARQLEAMQTATSQSTDINIMVDKVDNLQTTLGRLTNEMISTSEKSFMDRELSLRVREQALEMRDERMKEEREQLQEEKIKVYELNAKLEELCKGNQTVVEKDKWRIRDEWSRLNAEKQVFKDDQKYVMDALERQKETLEKTKTNFMREQHDLVVRVSTERASLEQERNDFYTRRNLDVRRLKEEANDLQHKLEAVETAESEVFEIRRHFEAKLSELQELEASLMDECLELEKLRDSIRQPPEHYAIQDSSRQTRRLSRRSSNVVEFEEVPKRNDSVRTVLKSHSKFLEKYTGQKVAAIAPNSITFSKQDFFN